jgi:enoyl-CoA hydratase
VSDLIEIEVTDGVGIARLNRPEARNALSRALRTALDEAIADFQADDSVAAIVITGAGTAFSAGVDIKEINADPAIARTVGPHLAPLFRSGKPLIGAINGPALTGGLELALGCDWLVASENARFGDTHARLGLTPGWGLTVLLSEAVGSRRAKQMVTTCEPIDASTALSWGLVNEVVPHGLLLERTMVRARAVANNDANAVSTVLKTIREQRSAVDAPLWAIEARYWIDPTTLDSEQSKQTGSR